ETARSVTLDVRADVRRAAHRHDLDAVTREITTAPSRERFERALIAHTFDENDRAHVPVWNGVERETLMYGASSDDLRPHHARHPLTEFGLAVALRRRVVEQAELHPRGAGRQRLPHTLLALELVDRELADVRLAVAVDRVAVAVLPARRGAAETTALFRELRVERAAGVLLHRHPQVRRVVDRIGDGAPVARHHRGNARVALVDLHHTDHLGARDLRLPVSSVPRRRGGRARETDARRCRDGCRGDDLPNPHCAFPPLMVHAFVAARRYTTRG